MHVIIFVDSHDCFPKLALLFGCLYFLQTLDSSKWLFYWAVDHIYVKLFHAMNHYTQALKEAIHSNSQHAVRSSGIVDPKNALVSGENLEAACYQ
jgi:hypothetical protein